MLLSRIHRKGEIRALSEEIGNVMRCQVELRKENRRLKEKLRLQQGRKRLRTVFSID